MVEPAAQHLYIMQNEYGCIKVGRSVDPWQRQAMLQTTERCRVDLIAAFEGGGEEEERILLSLREFRLAGEWFDGGDNARRVVESIFDLSGSEWKSVHDPLGAAEWLDHIKVVRAANYVRKAIGREIRELRNNSELNWVTDFRLLWCWYQAKTGSGPPWRLVQTGTRRTKQYLHPITNSWGELPAYSREICAALSLWPDEDRPAAWDGSALECCLGALTAMRARLRKVRPQEEPEESDW